MAVTATDRAVARSGIRTFHVPEPLETDDTDASPHLSVGEIGELWVGIGTADQVQSIEMHQRYFDAAAGFDNITVRIFDGADHGYTWPISPSYHEEAATVGWAATTDLFERVLA